MEREPNVIVVFSQGSTMFLSPATNSALTAMQWHSAQCSNGDGNVKSRSSNFDQMTNIHSPVPNEGLN